MNSVGLLVLLKHEINALIVKMPPRQQVSHVRGTQAQNQAALTMQCIIRTATTVTERADVNACVTASSLTQPGMR